MSFNRTAGYYSVFVFSLKLGTSVFRPEIAECLFPVVLCAAVSIKWLLIYFGFLQFLACFFVFLKEMDSLFCSLAPVTGHLLGTWKFESYISFRRLQPVIVCFL